MAKNIEAYINPPEPRIDSGTMQFMIIVAFGFDFFQGIILAMPFVGFIIAPLIGLFAWLTFFVWFHKHGITLTDSLARFIIINSAFLFELVPGINILPFWTLSVFISLVLIRAGDKRALSEFNQRVIN